MPAWSTSANLTGMRWRNGGTLQQSQLELRLLGHAVLGPRRVPDQLDVRADHAVDVAGAVGDLGDQRASHRAGRRGQGHGDLDVAVGGDVEAVDQPQVVDVDRDLRVEDVLEHGDHAGAQVVDLSLIHISEPTRLLSISYA